MSNTWFILILSVITGAQLVSGQCDCANQPDGYVCSVGCKEMWRCFNNAPVAIICGAFEVIDFENARCVPEDTAPPPCGAGADKNCTGVPDGSYPDIEAGCVSYYTCSNGYFTVRQFCPDGLVFNVNNGVCDWPYNVCPPCGTGENVGLCPTDPSPCNCTNLTPGSICYSDCQVLIVCNENGEGDTLVCEAGFVVDINTRTCKPRAEVPPPCGTAATTVIPATTTTTTTEAPVTQGPTTQPPPPTTTIATTTTTRGPSSCDDCTNQPDGTKCFVSCKEYHECLSGLLIRVTCDTNLVVDPVRLECALAADVCPPCGSRDCSTQSPSTAAPSLCDDCTNRPDETKCIGDCSYYIVCRNGQPQRVNCDTDSDMVVDPETITCNPMEDVCPPCGTNDYDEECPSFFGDDIGIIPPDGNE